jgi:hypothetical protein
MELEPRYGLNRLCRLGAEKDRGFIDLDDVRYEHTSAATSNAGVSARSTTGVISDSSAKFSGPRSRVQVGYARAGTRGLPRLHPSRSNGSLSRDFVAFCGLPRTAVPQSSLSRNEGVPGSSPGVGSRFCWAN